MTESDQERLEIVEAMVAKLCSLLHPTHFRKLKEEIEEIKDRHYHKCIGLDI